MGHNTQGIVLLLHNQLKKLPQLQSCSETSTPEGEKAAEATPSVKPESSEKQAEEKQRIEETVEQAAATADKEGKMRKTLKNNLFNRTSQNQPTKSNKESTASIEDQKKKSRTFQKQVHLHC